MLAVTAKRAWAAGKERAHGAAVLARFGRTDGDTKHFNLFDVRVGAYGPVWADLGRLLSGELRYGEGLQRAGEVAASAVYTVSAQMIEPLHRTLQQGAVMQR